MSKNVLLAPLVAFDRNSDLHYVTGVMRSNIEAFGFFKLSELYKLLGIEINCPKDYGWRSLGSVKINGLEVDFPEAEPLTPTIMEVLI